MCKRRGGGGREEKKEGGSQGGGGGDLAGVNYAIGFIPQSNTSEFNQAEKAGGKPR